MEIAPNSTVKLLSGVPLDNTYTDTIYFATAAAQQTFFNSKVKRSFTAQSYVRKAAGVIRLDCVADYLYDVDYLMFQNTSYGSKWFYAFITDVVYINDNRTDVYFELDVLQTWMFEMQLEVCFVEREHVTDDIVGAHIQPEPVNIDALKCYSQSGVASAFSSYKILIEHAQFNS